MTLQELERAKKENLCFVYLGSGYDKKSCPNKGTSHKHNVKKNDKQVHNIQVLPLDASKKFKEVEVCHSDATHACCVTSSMWILAVGPYDLVRMHGFINGHKVWIMVDDGATHNFLNYKLVKKLKLPQLLVSISIRSRY